jgi:hypothetical protein
MRIPALVFAGLLVAPLTLAAQTEASFKGRVLTDTTELPIPGVTVTIESLKLEATTDSAGNFIIRGIRPGAYVVTAKKIGFSALATRLRFTAREEVNAEFLMTRSAQNLPEARVAAKPPTPRKLIEFEERRAGAVGRFLTQADFEKRSYSLTSDILRQIPSLELVRDSRRPSQYYVAAGRMQGATRGGDAGSGVCFAAIVLDGMFVYQGHPGETPFDINSIGTGVIAGFEYYPSAASIPAKYNSSMRNTCGLAIIWTK